MKNAEPLCILLHPAQAATIPARPPFTISGIYEPFGLVGTTDGTTERYVNPLTVLKTDQ